MDLTESLLQRYKIKRANISAYHPESNGLVERGHAPVINSIAKFGHQRNTEDWTQFLSLALWADRISIRRSTGYSAFELIYGRECLLPIQLEISSWSVVDWDSVKTREDLILARMRQLDQQTLSRELAAETLMESRKSNKFYFDQDKQLRDSDRKLEVGDLVLLYKSKDDLSRALATKLADKWIGPYRVIKAPEDSTFYKLEELDGVPLAGTFAGNRLKKFFRREARIEDRNARNEALREMDEQIESRQRAFAERHADRLCELQEMASGKSHVNSEGTLGNDSGIVMTILDG